MEREKQRGESYTGTGTSPVIIGQSKESCVPFAKRITGINRSIGDGGRRGINSDVPTVGAIGVEKVRTHAVVIKEIIDDEIIIEEANFIRGAITRRVLKRSDFLGFII